MDSFSTTQGTFGTKEFLQSDSLVAKLAFLLLVIFGFMILLRVGISIISWLFSNNDSPHLIDGMVDATQMIIITQDPSSNSSIPIYRSNNANN